MQRSYLFDAIYAGCFGFTIIIAGLEWKIFLRWFGFLSRPIYKSIYFFFIAIYFVTGCVPVARSFGLTAAMGVETAGSAAVQCSFRGGWQRVVRPVAETLPAAFTRYIEAARLRQGVDVAVALPSLASLTDKMSSEESADAVTAHQDTAASAPAAAASWEQVEAAGDEFEPEP
eukprot:COSAG06_NODE_7888_length_2342_cov_0.953188_3_plen_172_part_01